jgi:hypothetical protein
MLRRSTERATDMKAVMIYPSGLVVSAEVTDEVTALQQAVGGYFEPVRVDYGCLGLVNEDGRRLRLPFNRIASAIAHTTIVGNMLVSGAADDHGDLTDVSEQVAESLLMIAAAV